MGLWFMLFISIIGMFCGLQETNAENNCSGECLKTLIMRDKASCDKKEKEKLPEFLAVYYDTKSHKCISTHCLKNYGDVFENEKECTEECKDCPKFLKQYSPDDECLKLLNISDDESGTKEVETGPTFVWTFHKGSGKCVKLNINNNGGLKKGWKVTIGVGLSTQEECNKRCPSIV